MFTLPNKTPTEKKVVTFPFADEAAEGSTLSSPTVDKSLIEGDDAGAALVVVGTPQLQGTDVLVLVEAGAEANAYGLLATVAADNGEVHQIAARMYVTAEAA